MFKDFDSFKIMNCIFVRFIHLLCLIIVSMFWWIRCWWWFWYSFLWWCSICRCWCTFNAFRTIWDFATARSAIAFHLKQRKHKLSHKYLFIIPCGWGLNTIWNVYYHNSFLFLDKQWFEYHHIILYFRLRYCSIKVKINTII